MYVSTFLKGHCIFLRHLRHSILVVLGPHQGWEPLGLEGTSAGTHCLIPSRVDNKGWEHSLYCEWQVVGSSEKELSGCILWERSIGGVVSNHLKSPSYSLNSNQIPEIYTLPSSLFLKCYQEMLMASVLLRITYSRFIVRKRKRRAHMGV